MTAKLGARSEVAERTIVASRPTAPLWGRPMLVGEETGKSTSRATAVQVQACRERLAEITSGRTISQQGLATTCKDPPHEGQPKEVGGLWSGA